MKSTWNLTEGSVGELKVEVTGKIWTEALDKAFKTVAKDLEIEGFRKGHVPENVAKKHINNQQVMLDAVESIAQQALVHGVEEHDIDLVTGPELNIDAMSDTEAKLTFICTTPPEVKLGEYKDLGIEKKEVTVTVAEVDAELEAMRERYAELALKEGAIEEGDTAVIDFEGFKDGEAFEGGKAENHNLEIGSGQFIPGFEEQLIGLESGAEKDVELSFPEDYHVEDLAGAPVVFKVKVHEVKERIVPELNDDFAKDTEYEVDTLEELKEKVKENLTKAKEDEAEQEHLNEVLDTIVENAEMDLPEVMITQETERLYNDMAMRIEQQGMPFEQFIQLTGQTKEALLENMRTDAEKQVKLRLVLDEIANVEEIEITETEIEEEYETIAELYAMELEAVKEHITSNAVEYDLRIRKSFDLIKESN